MLSFFREKKIRKVPRYVLIQETLCAILLIESVFNGFVFSEALPGGLLAGVTLAFLIAFINVIPAFMIGKFIYIQIWHISKFRKIACTLLSLIWLVLFALGWNLFVAYVRDHMDLEKSLGTNFLETGNFTALNLLTMNFHFIDIPLEEKMNWLALKKELHALDIFGYSSIGLPSLAEKNKLWAKGKIKEIDLYRNEHGLARIPKNPLPQDLIREINIYKEFVSQEDELRMWGECP